MQIYQEPSNFLCMEMLLLIPEGVGLQSLIPFVWEMIQSTITDECLEMIIPNCCFILLPVFLLPPHVCVSQINIFPKGGV